MGVQRVMRVIMVVVIMVVVVMIVLVTMVMVMVMVMSGLGRQTIAATANSAHHATSICLIRIC
jgi:flagellar basal body-associated protein FliL